MIYVRVNKYGDCYVVKYRLPNKEEHITYCVSEEDLKLQLNEINKAECDIYVNDVWYAKPTWYVNKQIPVTITNEEYEELKQVYLWKHRKEVIKECNHHSKWEYEEDDEYEDIEYTIENLIQALQNASEEDILEFIKEHI